MYGKVAQLSEALMRRMVSSYKHNVSTVVLKQVMILAKNESSHMVGSGVGFQLREMGDEGESVLI
jgi:hypothetical protein